MCTEPLAVVFFGLAGEGFAGAMLEDLLCPGEERACSVREVGDDAAE